MNPLYEQINIENYSPFSHINEISKKYQFQPFNLPFARVRNNVIPIHPDTFEDLDMDEKSVEYFKKVYPTSSFRTVYETNENVCYKLAVKRNITRSIRDMNADELEKSNAATELLSRHEKKGFIIIPEKTHDMGCRYLNYIERKMPGKEIYPWFYVIATSKFPKETRMEIMKKIINYWMQFAKDGIVFE